MATIQEIMEQKRKAANTLLWSNGVLTVANAGLVGFALVGEALPETLAKIIVVPLLVADLGILGWTIHKARKFFGRIPA